MAWVGEIENIRINGRAHQQTAFDQWLIIIKTIIVYLILGKETPLSKNNMDLGPQTHRRGICVIIPGVPGTSDNIEAISIVDKFLEHSRVYVFGNEGNPEYYISSADWMQRNFDHRVETLCPVLDKEIQQELMDMLQIQLRDNCKSRFLGENNLNQYRKTDEKTDHRSQFETYDYFIEKLKKRK